MYLCPRASGRRSDFHEPLLTIISYECGPAKCHASIILGAVAATPRTGVTACLSTAYRARHCIVCCVFSDITSTSNVSQMAAMPLRQLCIPPKSSSSCSVMHNLEKSSRKAFLSYRPSRCLRHNFALFLTTDINGKWICNRHTHAERTSPKI